MSLKPKKSLEVKEAPLEIPEAPSEPLEIPHRGEFYPFSYQMPCGQSFANEHIGCGNNHHFTVELFEDEGRAVWHHVPSGHIMGECTRDKYGEWHYKEIHNNRHRYGRGRKLRRR